MLTIFSPHTSPRLQYIVAVLFKESAVLTDDLQTYLASDTACINYSVQSVGKGLQMIPASLLFETNVQEQDITISYWQELPVFFSGNGELPFDFFSASFYLLSRYEEYLTHEKDRYGRYDHRNSLAYRYGFLDIPLIDCWMQAFEKVVRGMYTAYRLPQRQFVFQPTYDIDVAYRFRYASPFQYIKGCFIDLATGRFNRFAERNAVYKGKQKDSYDVYNWLDQLHRQHTLTPCYFFLVAEKQKGYDQNVNPFTRAMQTLIETHAKKYKIGIHPSLQSNGNMYCLEREIKLLAYYADQSIGCSRQHYLKMQLPETYEDLINAGIQEDHSMGYGSVNGFRASTCNPFDWYNLRKEQHTSLKIVPFCYMDSTAIFHEQLSTEMALQRMHYFLDTVRNVNGVFSYVMHNHFLAEHNEWMMWRNMYTEFLKTIQTAS